MEGITGPKSSPTLLKLLASNSTSSLDDLALNIYKYK